jgi:hypothetical protein
MTNLQTLPAAGLLSFTAKLSTRDWKQFTARDITMIDCFIHSDGCSAVPDFYRDCCVVHDWFYRTHRNFYGTRITRQEADRALMECIESKSPFGRWSPMAHWRYWAVRRFGRKAWDSA